MTRGFITAILFLVVGLIAAALIAPFLFPHADLHRIGEVSGSTLGPLLVVLGFGIGYRGDLRGRFTSTGVCFAMMLLVVIGGAISQLPQPIPASGPEWRPAADLVNQLGSESRFGGFELRIPRGYVPFPSGSAEFRKNNLVWKLPGQRGSFGDVIVLSVVPNTEPPGSPDPRRAFLRGVMHGHQKRYSHFQNGPIEEGQINGIPFLREAWTAVMPSTGEAIQGISYAGAEQFSIVGVLGMAGTPQHLKQISLIDAAAHTIHAVKK